MRIQHVVQSGFSTRGFVLSIVREAEDKDYQIAGLSDGCADDDSEVHLPNYQIELERTGKNLRKSLKINNLQLL